MPVSQVVPQAPLAPVQRCAICRLRLVDGRAGEILIHNAILKADAASGRVTAKCPRCKAWVEVPLRFTG